MYVLKIEFLQLVLHILHHLVITNKEIHINYIYYEIMNCCVKHILNILLIIAAIVHMLLF